MSCIIPSFIMRKIFLYIAIILWAAPALADDIVLTAKALPDHLPPGEAFRLVITLKGPAVMGLPKPQLPRLKGLEIVGKSTSQTLQVVNFSMRVTKQTTYRVISYKEGVFTIPPATLTYEGKTYKTRPINIRYDKSAPIPKGPRTARRRPHFGSPDLDDESTNDRPMKRSRNWSKEDLKVTMEVDKKDLVPFETFVATFSFYRAVDLWERPSYQKPEFKGFWVEEAPFPDGKKEQATIERIGDKVFHVTRLRYVLAPLTSGKHLIGSANISFLVDPWSIKQVLYTQPLIISVRPFPEKGKPNDFIGMVGSYKVTSGAEPLKGSVDSSIKFRVVIEGEGYLKHAPPPPKFVAPGLEVFDPKVTDIADKTGSGVHSKRTIEYPLIPVAQGKQTIPPLVFSWYDPAVKKYVSHSTRAITLEISASNLSATDAPRGKVERINKDIRYLKPDVDELQNWRGSYYRDPKLWLIIVAPFPVLLVGWFIARRKARLVTDVAYARSSKAARIAQAKFARIESIEDTREFYAGLDQGLRGYLGDIWNLPAPSVTTLVVEEKLADGPKGAFEGLSSLFKAVVEARYAPVSSKNRLTDLKTARSLVELLEKKR
ncbi:hypothetical protein MNBD_NITROSPINAE02-112 [hydrothermal vent metagenome]|uniref:Protein BatD n=1 Tax=hydrothermal vent metagenome TaxID=652676 RepID=A0A3B1CK21_9ZZZZ